MKPAILAVAALAIVATATVARANATDDANAGLTALQNGDNDGAINLFSHAIDSRRLKGDDLEFAYASRGQAYLNKFDYSDAISDLDRARQMKPDDTDAQNGLVKAVSMTLPAIGLPGQSGASMAGQAAKGLFGALLKGVVAGVAQAGQSN